MSKGYQTLNGAGSSTNQVDVLVFGPQSLSFGHEAATRLRSQLLGDAELYWTLNTLKSLHNHWQDVACSIPVLQNLHGEELLQNLRSWVETGQNGVLVWPLPNIILTPLIVVLHLAEFQQRTAKFSQDRPRTTPTCRRTRTNTLCHQSEVLGLCTGLLSAAAVCCSDNEEQLREHGAAAIRLAMLVGAIVDARDLSLKEPERATSFSVSWSQPGSEQNLEEILKTVPGAYVSVVQDERKLTVTTTKSTATKLQNSLKASGFVVVSIPLRGYFHWEGHLDDLKVVINFCESNNEFRLERCTKPPLPIRSSGTDINMFPHGLHQSIIKSMLVEQSNWYTAFKNIQTLWASTDQVQLTCFGPERCVPAWIKVSVGSSQTQTTKTDAAQIVMPSPQAYEPIHDPTQDYVAVIGMACNLPGAADMDEYWELLCHANSQHVEVPPERFSLDTPWRQHGNRKWYGNFIKDHDAFDERFFKKSPREAASMDPQQRLMLQVSYQAVEQSGYFSATRDKCIGCYIAFGLNDYEENISCHPANAYAATGNLKAFTAGRISHYFGWTGPGLTIDSACSSSAVAIHLGCQSILSGECNAALVGGVNVMAGPEWFHNLAGASFLSPTGQCKPFDATADGYCRGEAVGAIFLKRLSSAVKDGDQIFGVIAASAVQQNMNTTAITVPNEPSLTDLFRKVTSKSGIAPSDVSYVEAHGTGTPVGDPAEYDSIRRVFGGPIREGKDRLSVGSVKGLLGHAESASGMVALLKILAMMHYGHIPPQASFSSISPMLHTSPADHMDISTVIQPWNAKLRAALINNYGASGSNASLLVFQPSRGITPSSLFSTSLQKENNGRSPFGFYASDENSLRRYSSKLIAFMEHNEKLSLADLSFQVARQSNRALRCLLSFSCRDTSQLKQKLNKWDSEAITTVPAPRPVILCFGGQRSTFIGLDREVYNDAKILRVYLDRCNSVCEDLGTSIYPAIFQTTPVQDITQLHAALFSLQYACARSWLDCMPGVEIAAVVGHSFGELSALCVSGAVPFEDMLKYVVGRARLIRDAWGPDKGSMLAVEADLKVVERLLAEAAMLYQGQHATSIACFNAPTSFTLAGPATAIDTVIQVATTRPDFASVKLKKLDVTNAYHCSLADAILPGLDELAFDVKVHEPCIHIEQATKDAETLQVDRLLATHSRRPVYFCHAVRRLAERHSSAVWLEAGSSSTITTLANRALQDSLGSISTNYFQPINIIDGALIHGLSDATLALWRGGINVSFWPHYHSQTQEYRPILLPPYQFEKKRHWMERKKIQHSDESSFQHKISPGALISFLGYQDKHKKSVRFRVNTESEKFQSILKGHIIAQNHPLCPSMLQLDMVIDALMMQNPNFADGTYSPQLKGMDSIAPMLLDTSRTTWLDAHAIDHDALVWEFTIFSPEMNSTDGAVRKTYVKGKIAFCLSHSPDYGLEFSRLERLVRRERCLNVLDGDDADEVIQGQRHIYRLFSDVVEYGVDFQGLQKLVAKGAYESAGRVVLVDSERSWLDYAMTDCFCQVAGIFVNTMTERSHDEIYISDRIDQLIRSPRLRGKIQRPTTLEIYACHTRPSSKEFVSDVFIFNPRDGALLEAILGIHYLRTPKKGLSRALMRISGAPVSNITETQYLPGTGFNIGRHPIPTINYQHKEVARKDCVKYDKEGHEPQKDVPSQLRILVASISGLDTSEIKEDSQLTDLGIDSLMGMELSRELEAIFNCTAHESLIFELTDFRSLINWVEETLGVSKTMLAPSTGKAQVLLDGPQTPSQDPYQNGMLTPPPDFSLELSASIILKTFSDCKEATDRYIKDSGLAGYSKNILPKSDELCITYICDAFEQLGCCIRSASPGEILTDIKYLPRHQQFVMFLYELLEKRAGLIEYRGPGEVLRTAAPAPSTPAHSSLQTLNDEAPAHAPAHNLTALTGTRLADCLSGVVDGIQLIFGTPEGREMASAMYGECPINTAWIKQLEDFVRHLTLRLPSDGGIRILEMGAGTGGTTSKMVSVLATLGMQVTYTVTDISSSLVAAARKRFKQHSFVDFRVLDIENEPPLELLNSYHMVFATNCVHATSNLVHSAGNIRKMLRPDGFLLMLEMTEPLIWVDLVFGLIDGWWAFNDGRKHALASPEAWEKALHEAGYGKVEWTDGELPESNIQRLILAMAASERYDTQNPSEPELLRSQQKYNDTDGSDLQARRDAVDRYVQQYTTRFTLVSPNNFSPTQPESSTMPFRQPVFLVTGATGSLGSHIVQYLSSLPEVSTVICLNRISHIDAQSRQHHALRSKGIDLNAHDLAKLRVFQTDTSRPLLGLCSQDYDFLAHNVTHIIHNAWPMSISRVIDAFELQFEAMGSIMRLASDAHACQGRKIAFQFISSIGVVGQHPLLTGETLIPEVSVQVDSVLPNGYNDAKLVCERMLSATVERFPEVFSSAMSVRVGQIAGSRATGYWNTLEHFAFIVKSSHTLGVLPDLKGSLSWCPVDDVAAVLGELLLNGNIRDHEIYHVENPVRQDWQQMIQWLAVALNVHDVVPYDEWLSRVRESSATNSGETNPAARIVEFLENHFVRMSCGGVVLSTKKSKTVSETLRGGIAPINEALLNKYVKGWVEGKFL